MIDPLIDTEDKQLRREAACVVLVAGSMVMATIGLMLYVIFGPF